MRLTREQAAKNRQTIVDTAGRLFRERGFEGVSVADLMSAAGFTHGGFYNHFASKEALAAECCATAIDRSTAGLAERFAGARGWREFVEGYLSPAHRDEPTLGCTVAALAGDAGRQGEDVQAIFAAGIEGTLAALTGHFGQAAPGRHTEASRALAVQVYNEIIGAMVLSRAVVGADRALADEILAATRRKLLRHPAGEAP